ncbi:hypothetical protein, partial [Streptococcus pneumoniae]|uniref:hypothetical protein n=1 Tax=Streptococcus pneumoniae TaxID=1313 RepID=UPI0018B0F2FC
VLGASADERLARLLRYRALVQSGCDERAVNAAIHREYGVIGFELLTGEQADAVLAGLEGAG